MAFGLENKKVALVGIDSGLSDAYLPFLQNKGLRHISIFPAMVEHNILISQDASVVHLTHNEEDLDYWVENLLAAHKAGSYMLVTQVDMYECDVKAREILQIAGILLRSTSKYRSTFHEMLDHLKMTDLKSDGQ